MLSVIACVCLCLFICPRIIPFGVCVGSGWRVKVWTHFCMLVNVCICISIHVHFLHTCVLCRNWFAADWFACARKLFYTEHSCICLFELRHVVASMRTVSKCTHVYLYFAFHYCHLPVCIQNSIIRSLSGTAMTGSPQPLVGTNKGVALIMTCTLRFCVFSIRACQRCMVTCSFACFDITDWFDAERWWTQRMRDHSPIRPIPKAWLMSIPVQGVRELAYTCWGEGVKHGIQSCPFIQVVQHCRTTRLLRYPGTQTMME